MSNTQHTPTPWKAYRPKGSNGFYYIESDNGISIATLYIGNVEEDANRIVACVNALEGADDPAEYVRNLEDMAASTFEANVELEHDRNRLIAALKGMRDAYDGVSIRALTNDQIEAWNDANELLVELLPDQEDGGDV